jgi:PAS domain S-box-containing protein
VKPSIRAWQVMGVLALAAVYALVARGALSLYAVRGFAALVWPPTGLALAALLLGGRTLWPGVFLGAFVANCWAGATPLVATGIAVGNTLEAVAALAALRALDFRPSLTRARDVIALAVAALLTSVISAGIGMGSLVLGGVIPRDEVLLGWGAWWMGDTLGYLVVAPLLLTWATGQAALTDRSSRLELVVLGIAGTVTAAFVFLTDGAGPFRQPFLVFPVLVWAALRFGQRATATATIALSVLAIAATVNGLGPFAGPNLHDSLTSLQVFVAAMALGALSLGAVVAERTQAERALGEKHSLLEAVVEGIDDPVFAKDLEGRYLMINEAGARYLGQPAAEIIGQDDTTLFPPESARLVRDLDSTVILDGQTRNTEEVVQTASGRITFHTTKAPLRNGEGHTAGLVGISRDITARKQAEIALRRAIAVRDEFLSIASHELRTPLSVLLLELASLERLFGSLDLGSMTERTRDKTARVVRQAHRLTHLVERLLEVSRIESGRLELELQDVDLAALAREVVDRFAEEAAKAGSTILVDASSAVRGHWDPVRLEQVLSNLLSNALKFGAAKPVHVAVTAEGAVARMVVRDAGIGLPDEDRERVFGRFERAVPTRHFGGLGLGLYIARQIISAHGGTIQAVASPGGGTTFEVQLPRPAGPPV